MNKLLEYWKPVVGYEDIYQVSNTGCVCRVAKARGSRPFKRLAPILNGERRDYFYVNLCKDGVCKLTAIHRIVGKAFLGETPPGMNTNHMNGRKSCNRLSNLEYVTLSENQQHAVRTGLQKRKLTDADVRSVRALLATHTISETARRFRVGHTIISEIKRGLAYSWLE